MLNDMELCRTDGHLSVTAILHGGGGQREERAENQQRKEVQDLLENTDFTWILKGKGSHRDDMN